jgi:hypothetical protein
MSPSEPRERSQRYVPAKAEAMSTTFLPTFRVDISPTLRTIIIQELTSAALDLEEAVNGLMEATTKLALEAAKHGHQ